MIIEALFDAFFVVLYWILGHMPAIGFAVENLGSLAGLFELFAKSSFIIPWKTLLTCLSFWLLLQSLEFSMGLLNWLIAKIPTID